MVRLKVQPLKLRTAFDYWATEETLLARDAWVKGVKKPRDLLRGKEPPPKDVSLRALEREGLLEVLEPITVNSVDDLKGVPPDVDLIVIGDSEDWFADDKILQGIAELGKPVMAEWDSWGYSIHGRISKFRLRKFSKVKRYFTMGVDDLLCTIRALLGWKMVRSMRILYIGRMPSHSVFPGDSVTFQYIKDKFGSEITQLKMKEFIKAVEEVEVEEVKGVAERLRKEFILLDGRDTNLEKYVKIYKALKDLLSRYQANAVTIDCAALPSIEYVPCLAFSLLIDEGIPCGCEADLPALFTMAMLMGASSRPAMMGNLNENVTHMDIEDNIVVLNHDVVPTALACRECKVKVRDFHATGKGATPYAELQTGMPVTLAGMHWDMDEVWASKGIIRWTEDTIHCRISVGIEVDDAKRLTKEAFGHHVVMVYGDYVDETKRMADLFELKCSIL